MRAIVLVFLILTVYSNSKYFVVNRTPLPSVVETGPFTLVRPDYSGGGFKARLRAGQCEAMPPPPNIF